LLLNLVPVVAAEEWETGYAGRAAAATIAASRWAQGVRSSNRQIVAFGRRLPGGRSEHTTGCL